MAPSVRPLIATTVLMLTTPLIASCDSTMDQSARAKLAATREIGSRTSQRVDRESATVKVRGVTLLRDRETTAVVVELVNTGKTALTDLPVSVGVRRDGEEVLLNKAPDLGWFQTHVPAIAAGGTATWVFQSPPGRGSRAGDEPFARVGSQPAPAISSAAELPTLRATWLPSEGTPGAPTFSVQNTSDVPQFQLQVYAFARRGEAIIGAGVATVDDLAPDQTKTIAVRLSGRPGEGPFTAVAIPTIFQ